MKGQREFRILNHAEVRAKTGEKPGIEGYAAVFSEFYDNGWFIETIKPGAFARALKEKQDVRCLFNHDSDMVVGRTKSGTLSLSEDKKGLYFACDTPDTQLGRDLYTLIQRGDVDGCSIGFIATEQTWREEKKDKKVTLYREIVDVDLLDAGPVTYPAFVQTSVDVREARSLWPDGVPAEILKHVPSLVESRAADECQCTCPECQDGDCANCSDQNCADSYCQHGESRSLVMTPEEYARLQLRARQALA